MNTVSLLAFGLLWAMFAGNGWIVAAHASDLIANALETYRHDALADAARTVEENTRLRATGAANAKQVTSRLGLGRFYKVGDSWLVAVSRVSPGMVHMSEDRAAHTNRFLDALFYEFRVKAVRPEGEADIEVSRVGVDRNPIEGARVTSMTITVNRDMRLVQKSYSYRDLAHPIVAEFSGTRNVPMGFDSFPVELPDFERAKLLPTEQAGSVKLPRTLTHHTVRKLDPALTLRFESPDLFARPVRVTWQRGDLWPALVETTSGISMLIRQEKQ